MQRAFIIERVVLTIIGSFGVLGNLVAVLHFGSAKRRQHRFYVLIIALSVVDAWVIILFIWFFSISEFLNSSRQSHYWSVWLYPLLNIFCTGSIFLTVAVSFDRYLAICKPLFYHAHPWTTRFILLPVFFISII